MADNYQLQAWVSPGVQVAESERPTFDEIMAEAMRLHAKYPDATLALYNTDKCDLDDDGLTNEEQERWENAGQRGYCSCGRPLVQYAPATMSSPDEWGCPVCDR